MSVKQADLHVHVVSHGPHCLDGVTAAVVVARFHPHARVFTQFSSNSAINERLLGLRCEPAGTQHAVWITDISWTDPAVDRHLTELSRRGVALYWIDHHRTALERYRSGAVNVPFTDLVLDESYAASRLTFEYLAARRGLSDVADALRPLVAMADDNDRWVHEIAGSRELALAVAAMAEDEAYTELLGVQGEVRLTPRLAAAASRIEQELQRSSAIAESTRVEHQLKDIGLTLVTAVCVGYSSDIADRWGRTARQTVYAFFDAQSLGISLRRSPDCRVDLSHVARRLDGGGHPAAAGCELPALHLRLSHALAEAIAPTVAAVGAEES